MGVCLLWYFGPIKFGSHTAMIHMFIGGNHRPIRLLDQFGRQTLFLVHNTCIFFKYLFKKSTNTFWKTCSFLGKSWLTLSFTKKHPLIGPNVHYCRAPQKLATEEIYVLRQKYSCTLLRKIFRASLPKKKWKNYTYVVKKVFVDICANLIEKFT